MANLSISVIVGVVILAAAIPYVARIRHPEQRPLAAYLIFVSVFVASAVVLFSLLVWLTGTLGLADALGRLGPAVLFLVLVFLPAGALATWQARQPPWRRGPPD
jgi:hypothetical protein